MSYCVKDLYQQNKEKLCLELLTGNEGLKRRLLVPEAHRPGLSLTGFLKSHASKRILVLGKVEVQYINSLDEETQVARLDSILQRQRPAVIAGRNLRPPAKLLSLCAERKIPLFRSSMTTMNLLSELNYILGEEFAPRTQCHATLVEVFGVGVLIQGDSGVGKSEAALGLIERGHRLVTDDVVKIRKRENTYLEGYGAELTQHHMEIRGIGIINVAHLYGAVCVRRAKSIDLVVKMEVWDDNKYYDRAGLEEKFCEYLGLRIPYHILPVKPGRDVVLLLETIALNHRLIGMGYNSALEFNTKLLETISSKSKKQRKGVLSQKGIQR
ncbi:MAG: HPr kinase/phosphorylase [Chlamydiia bacterium]|nr:HPr kinase/phosphorylase [Chlamydiia bacterium]